MINLLDYPYRVLIVDDEERDWAAPMKQLLTYAARDAKLTGLKIEVTFDQRGAERLLASRHFHLVSLDMRLPERMGEPMSVTTGIRLARSFPYAGFPKHLIYSQLLRDEEIRQHPSDAARVLQIPADLYAKPTGGDRDQEPGAIEVLKASEWAQRVVDSLSQDWTLLRTSRLPDTEDSRPLTVLGAYLAFGPDRLPPVLARHLQELANHWETKDARRVDAAIRFIESTARLALAQTAVFLRQDGQAPEPPDDERMETCLNTLGTWRPRVTRWNWSNFLTPAALDALRAALGARNEERHGLQGGDPVKAWANLRVPLQYAMDIAAYWVRHPLCIDLCYSRDGWNAELLAGTTEPRKRRPLPVAMDFPVEAVRSGAWQSVWLIDGDEPKQHALPWDGWLEPDPGSERPWWLPMCRDQRGRRVWLDLSSGNKKTDK